jgi:hypothetical protein
MSYLCGRIFGRQATLRAKPCKEDCSQSGDCFSEIPCGELLMKSVGETHGTAIKEEGHLKEILVNLPQNQPVIVWSTCMILFAVPPADSLLN